MKTARKWLPEEDSVTLRYVRAYPYNLHKAFVLTSEHLCDAGSPRTVTAVSAHWYSVLSKREDALSFFTASAKHVSKNRKNGQGVESNSTIWQRFMRIIRNL